MGIKHLWKILDENNIGEVCNIDNLQGEKVAVDISGWIVQSKKAKYGENKIRKPHLRNLFWRVSHMLENRIKPIFVFDGGQACDLKQEELARRRSGDLKDRSNDVHNNATDRFKYEIVECCEFLDCLGLPWTQSENEAEAMCSWLNQKEVVSGVISDDSDCFPYGADTVYRNFSLKGSSISCNKYSVSTIEEKLKLSRTHFVALALLLGCDYGYQGVPKIGKEYAIEWMKTLQVQNITPFERFDEWRSNSSYYDDIEQFKSNSPKKSIHCGKCGHTGGLKMHSKRGCELCQTELGCKRDCIIKCLCDFHQKERLFSENSAELKIRRGALKVEDFPDKEIVKTFMHPVTNLDEPPDFTWKMPDFEKLKCFLREHLKWESAICDKRMLPMKVATAMQGPVTSSVMLPQRILKCCRRRGKEMYEVEWQEAGASGDHQTCHVQAVPKDEFSEKYSEIVTEFDLTMRNKEKGNRKRKLKELKDQKSMKDFFQVKKVARPRKK